jgi:hypothetical protein
MTGKQEIVCVDTRISITCEIQLGLPRVFKKGLAASRRALQRPS